MRFKPDAYSVEKALETGDIHFDYQPIVSLLDYKIQGYEALVRWEGLTTMQVVDAIESNGLVAVWLKTQIKEITQALRLLPDKLFIAFNLGQDALLEPILVTELETFPYPGRLHLEILESVNLNLGTAAVLDHINARITIKADDIGIEFPWLDRLVGVYAKRFDGLKLCESLTRNLLTDADCRTATNHIIGMARDKGLSTTAEWVHDPKQAKMLKIFGCGYGQGELFGLGGPLPK
jgi:EAL domain-containing protein (putative c-di-GMP-specific phosphodiesterase class I)